MTWRFEVRAGTTPLIYPGRTWDQAMRLFRLFSRLSGEGDVLLYGEPREQMSQSEPEERVAYLCVREHWAGNSRKGDPPVLTGHTVHLCGETEDFRLARIYTFEGDSLGRATKFAESVSKFTGIKVHDD